MANYNNNKFVINKKQQISTLLYEDILSVIGGFKFLMRNRSPVLVSVVVRKKKMVTFYWLAKTLKSIQATKISTNSWVRAEMFLVDRDVKFRLFWAPTVKEVAQWCSEK